MVVKPEYQLREIAMDSLPVSLRHHRVQADSIRSASEGRVSWEPIRSLWFFCMAVGATVGGALAFSWAGVGVFLLSTAIVLLMGHSLGMHRKLIHNSYDCPKWLEYLLVYCGVLVGLNGPLGMIRAHELRDYAQRLPTCHDFLRHRSSYLKDLGGSSTAS
jgi:stearoyl-CoA desaturase (delta-9 desaturase)